MSQTKAQQTKSIRVGSVKLLLDGTDIGLLDNAQLEILYNVLELRASNGYLPPRKKVETIKITAEIWELFLNNLAEIDGHGQLSEVAGTSTAITGEILSADGAAANVPLKLKKSNASGVIPTSITLNQNGSTTVTAANYTVYVKHGEAYIVPKITLSGEVNIDYTVTPAASKIMTWSDVSRVLSFHEFKMINTDENGKKLTIRIPKGYSGSNLTWGFLSDDTVDDVMKQPIEFTAYPDDNNKLLEITDEQAV